MFKKLQIFEKWKDTTSSKEVVVVLENQKLAQHIFEFNYFFLNF
jgi:hypothetical protein